MPHTQHTHTPSHSFFCRWPTAPSIAHSLVLLCAVIGHTALALLVVSPAVACGGAVQAAGLINPKASAVSSKLQLCFPTMTSPHQSSPPRRSLHNFTFFPYTDGLICVAWSGEEFLELLTILFIVRCVFALSIYNFKVFVKVILLILICRVEFLLCILHFIS